jgi:hypothetical protein
MVGFLSISNSKHIKPVIYNNHRSDQSCNQSEPVNKVEPAGSYRSRKTFRPAGPDRFTFFPTGYNSGSDTLFSLHRSNFCTFISSLDNSYAKHSLKRYENIFRQFYS